MAYANTSSSKRTLYSSGSRGSNQLQQPTYSHAQEHHVYEEQPYYSNEQTTPRQNIGGDNRRSGGVCDVLIFFFLLKITIDFDLLLTKQIY